MKKLCQLVNIIPILAKGDQYTQEEVMAIKQSYKEEFTNSKLDLFDCEKPISDSESMKKLVSEGQFGASPPFMITSSNRKFMNNQGKLVQGRKYPWGICNQWNPQHSDYKMLYKLLIGYYSTELISLTDFFQHQYISKKDQKKQMKKEQKLGIMSAIQRIIMHLINY